MRKLSRLAVVFALYAASAMAGPLVYQPVNPSFGGNPLNGPNLLNSANSQNKLTTDPNAQSLFGRTAQSQLDLFNQRLQSLILDRIATSLTSSLFDASGNLKPGRVETSTFLIDIVDQGSGLLLITTTDKTTGASTSFQISNAP
jgi:curli production assembly/transport component CsgF